MDKTQHPSEDDDLELEVKYMLSSREDLAAAKSVFLGMTEKILRERDYTTTIRYYDTEDFSLIRAQATLRKMDACPPYFAPEIDVKSIGHVSENGILVRKEYQFPMLKDEFNLAAVNKQEALDLLKPAQGKSLSEVFYTVNARNDLRAVFDIGGRKVAIELCVERTDYIAKDGDRLLQTSCELEIEYSQKHSDPAITQREAESLLRQVGDAITGGMAAAPHAKSKAEIGFSFFLP